MKLTRLMLLGAISCMGILASGCGTFDRSYVDQMDRESDGFFSAGRDFPVVSGDTGEAYRSKDEINKRTPASERTRKKSKEEASLKEELSQKESNLTEEETAAYSKDLKYLNSDSDKLYYLSLGAADRADYIKTKVQEDANDHMSGDEMVKKRSIHSEEIYVGMSKDEVIKVWGRPSKVQIAGNPRYQNELWLFNEDGSVSQVYFEGGRVNGWALDL